jgi:hypothetical protein
MLFPCNLFLLSLVFLLCWQAPRVLDALGRYRRVQQDSHPALFRLILSSSGELTLEGIGTLQRIGPEDQPLAWPRSARPEATPSSPNVPTAPTVSVSDEAQGKACCEGWVAHTGESNGSANVAPLPVRKRYSRGGGHR